MKRHCGTYTRNEKSSRTWLMRIGRRRKKLFPEPPEYRHNRESQEKNHDKEGIVMGYTPELKKLIKVVEKTRPARVERKMAGEEFPMLTLEERKERLKYHPDYKEESRREVRVGPSKGYKISNEFVELLEAKSRVDPDTVDLSQVDYETDVLILGGGGAGCSAALIAQEQGAKVIIATKLRLGDANTMMAEGGIQAATKGEKDSPYYHYLDVLGGGHFSNDPELVYTLVTEAPKAIGWLESLGAMLSKLPDGRLSTLHGGGTCRKRMHSAGDITGAEIMRTVRDEVQKPGKGYNHTGILRCGGIAS